MHGSVVVGRSLHHIYTKLHLVSDCSHQLVHVIFVFTNKGSQVSVWYHELYELSRFFIAVYLMKISNMK